MLVSIPLAIAAATLAHGLRLDHRQLNSAATTPATLEQSNYISKDLESLNNDPSSYYLSYGGENFAKPYAKFATGLPP